MRNSRSVGRPYWDLAWTTCGALALTLMESCASPPPRPSDAVRPDDVNGRVDFSALFGRTFGNNSVIVASREPGLMRRVMVSPNVVFESSRSSLQEPNTIGPASPPPTAPGLPNALGTAVTISDSSRLLRYFVDHGSAVVAPVISRLLCGATTGCPEGSWVERTLLMVRAAPQAATADAPGAAENQFMLPTSILAVRHLGSANSTWPMVIEETARGQYRARIAQDDSEPTLCRGLRLVVPNVALSGEVISTSTGQVIARLDEVRAIATQAETQRRVSARTWQPVEGRLPYNEGVHVYVSSWSPVDTLCESITAQYAVLRREIGDAADTSATVQELIRTSLDPLYRSESAAREPSPRRAVLPPPEPIGLVAPPPPTAAPAAAALPEPRRRRRR